MPAKVNLHLSVGPRRDDGYHELTTVFQAVSLYDEVCVEPAPRLACVVTGEDASEVPTTADNLAVAAAILLAGRAGRAADVAISLRKAIPVAGGMAGGSADAAATLLACDALWGLGLDRSELGAIAADLGSDVPFLLHGGTALGHGRGEQVTPVLGRGEFHWVFAVADRGLSTREVYAEHDRALPLPEQPAASVLAAVRAGDAAALGRALHNDLQAAALRLRPALRRTLAAGVEHGAVGSLVSGSGPTCMFLARDRSHAISLAASLAGAGVCRSVRTAFGPVPGARIVPATSAGEPAAGPGPGARP